MNQIKRGHDAQDDAPASKPQSGAQDDKRKQDASNYETTDGDKAIDLEDLSSANDEGAN